MGEGMNALGVLVLMSAMCFIFSYGYNKQGYREGFAEGQRLIIELKDECEKSLPRDKYCTIIAVEAE